MSGDVENDPRVHVFEAQGVRWKRLRTIASSAFSAGSLKKIHPTLESSVLALMDLFDKKANQRAFNIFPFYKEFTMDVICRIAMGQQGSRMFMDEGKIFKRNFRQPIFYLAAAAPGIRVALRRLFMIVASARKTIVPALFEKIYETIDKRIEKRAEDAAAGVESHEATDFIDLFLDARAEQDFDDSGEFSRMGLHVRRYKITLTMCEVTVTS
ncbi:unnamed protein product [Heligmosomoides polygyrus]|uniref:Cytochrome P450 n=1 Tax=Heligmosomoides polygyrus TaxID=6339 RepID=A0A3P7U2Q6_HELPZ|nr:unnamed protein product [Heligmosomoides polygyrus]